MAILVAAVCLALAAASSRDECPSRTKGSCQIDAPLNGNAQLQGKFQRSELQPHRDHITAQDTFNASADDDEPTQASFAIVSRRSLSQQKLLYKAAEAIKRGSERMNASWDNSINEINHLITGIIDHESSSQDTCSTQLLDFQHQLTTLHESTVQISTEVQSTVSQVAIFEKECKEKNEELTEIEKVEKVKLRKCVTQRKVQKKTLETLRFDMKEMRHISHSHIHVQSKRSLLEVASDSLDADSEDAALKVVEPPTGEHVARVRSMVQKTKDLATKLSTCKAKAALERREERQPSELSAFQDDANVTGTPLRPPACIRTGDSCVTNTGGPGTCVPNAAQVRLAQSDDEVYEFLEVDQETNHETQSEGFPSFYCQPIDNKPVCAQVGDGCTAANGQPGVCTTFQTRLLEVDQEADDQTSPGPWPPQPVGGLFCQVSGGTPSECQEVVIELEHQFTTSYVSLTRMIEEYEVVTHSTVCEDTVQEEYTEESSAVQDEANKVCTVVQTYISQLEKYKFQYQSSLKTETKMKSSIKSLVKQCGSLTSTETHLEEVEETLGAIGDCPGIGDISFHLPTWVGKWIKFQQDRNKKNKWNDNQMLRKCKEAFGRTARPAEVSEIDNQGIEGMPSTNTGDFPVLGACPLCKGMKTPGLTVTGYGRVCWDAGSSFSRSGRRKDCGGGPRNIMCVLDEGEGDFDED